MSNKLRCKSIVNNGLNADRLLTYDYSRPSIRVTIIFETDIRFIGLEVFSAFVKLFESI